MVLPALAINAASKPRLAASALISLCCPVLFQARLIDSLNRTSYYFRLAHVLIDERFCISAVYIIRMSFSASKYVTIDMSSMWFSRVFDCLCVCVCVCVCLFVIFCQLTRSSIHLDPEVRHATRERMLPCRIWAFTVLTP